RSTDDPLGQLAIALCEFCRMPYVNQTAGGSVRVELGSQLNRALGMPGNELAPAFTAVRDSLSCDPDRLREILEAVTVGLPFTLVVVMDQTEEMFTLAGKREHVTSRNVFLESVRRFAASRSPAKLVLSLRTEFFGRLVDRLRREVTGAIGT